MIIRLLSGKAVIWILCRLIYQFSLKSLSLNFSTGTLIKTDKASFIEEAKLVISYLDTIKSYTRQYNQYCLIHLGTERQYLIIWAVKSLPEFLSPEIAIIVFISYSSVNLAVKFILGYGSLRDPLYTEYNFFIMLSLIKFLDSSLSLLLVLFKYNLSII